MKRSEIISRTTSIWPAYKVAYSMSANRDCSAYVSEILNIPRQNTATLVTNGYIYPIDPNNLRPGDFVGKCGPGTEGANGHIQVFWAWLNNDPNDNRYFCWEMTPPIGPRYSLIDWPIGHYKAYRYVNVIEDMDGPGTYTVVRGDTLSGIATRFGWPSWQSLYERNQAVIGSNPNLIYPGMVLDVSNPPTTTARKTYTVVKGDTLTHIAIRHGVTVAQLVAWNNISNPNLIYPGQTFFVEPPR